MAADPSGFELGKLIEWVVLGFTAVIAWLFRGHHSRITELERTVMRKEDFHRYEEKSDQSRNELRESIIKLYDRIDELKSIMLGRNHDH